MKPIIEARNISKKFCRDYKRSIRYGFADIFRSMTLQEPASGLREREFWAIKDISLQVLPGQAVGIIGANGSGKTTLLRTVSGFIKPDTGSILVRGRISPIFARGAGFDPVLSGYENIHLSLTLLGCDKLQISKKIEPIIEFSELTSESLSAPVKTYSSGMLARLGFSCVVNSDPSLLIIDEALAVGDMRFRTKCYRKLGELKAQGTSFVMVSHSPNAIMQVCDRALYLKKGRLNYEGNVQEALKIYDADEQLRVERKAMLNEAESANTSRDLSSFEIIHFTSAKMSEGCFLADTAQDFDMKVEFLAKRILKNIQMHMIVRHVQNPEINFIHQVHKISSIEGAGEIEISLPKLSLRPGDYGIKLFFTLEDEMNYLDFRERTILKVANEDYFRGSHFQDLNVRIHCRT